jgi:outer membrane protein OmpA-like peptidoglycan-associated protein
MNLSWDWFFKMKKIVLLLILLSNFLLTFSQGNTQYTNPVRVSSTINSYAEEGYPLISSDGKSMYFVRSFHEENMGGKLAGQDIWMSHGEGADQWTTSSNSFPFINNKNNNVVIGQSRDGSTLYLLNEYSSGSFMKVGLSEWKVGSQEPPVPIKIPGLNITGKYYGFYMHPDAEVLLISAELERSKGMEDIYISVKDTNGIWQEPINVGGAINSSGFEMSPFITDDLQTIYFSSSGRGGRGSADIFYSTRRNEKWNSWRPARNMGKTINSKGFDAYFSIRNGEAYFCSNRDADMSDIYYTRVITNEELLAKLPKPQSVYFSLNTYMIDGQAKEILDDLVKLLKENEQYKVVLSGYTCKTGEEMDNMKLAGLRANSVSDYLQIYGIDDDRIDIEIIGDKQAKHQADDEEVQKLFRKVVIKFAYM